jgi:transposase-like protein
MERYAMNENRVVALREKGAIDDPLTEILRSGARRLIAQAVEAEFETFLGSNADLVLADGRQRVVRHGHDPVRAIQTGIGPVDVEKPKARDRGAAAGDRIRFTSAILPKWARRTKSLDALLPVLYLRGVSAGDFQEALAALLGKDAPNLSPAVIARLKSEWEDEYRRWQDRDLSARRYVYVWADGVYLQARMEPQAECMLVLIGATPEGVKELIGFQTGMRESAQSWRELLVDLKARGLSIAPELAIGDGALGFWKALDEALPTTRHQRCWLHKTTNVLNKFPKSVQPNAHKDLREIWLAPRQRAGRHDDIRREIRAQIRQGRRLPDQRPRDAADVLRLPRRSLGPFAHHEPHRKRLRNRQASHRPNERRAVARHRSLDGLQVGDGGVENLAQAARSKPVAEARQRRQIPRRNRGRAGS